jgi:hypothetical protein
MHHGNHFTNYDDMMSETQLLDILPKSLFSLISSKLNYRVSNENWISSDANFADFSEIYKINKILFF